MNTLLASQKTSPTIEQYYTYQEAYDFFNKNLFGGSLPRCILTFSRKRNASGFFINDQWSNSQGQHIHEISLSPDSLEQPMDETMSTLVHEMTHLWQYEFGNPGSGNYHNRQWANKMKQLGLMPSSTGRPGGKEIGSPMSHYILEDGKFARAFKIMPMEYLIPWNAHMPLQIKPLKRKEHQTNRNKNKYFCPNCSLNVWGKPNLDIRCEQCQLKLKVGNR